MGGASPKRERRPYAPPFSMGAYRSELDEACLLSAALSVIGDRWSLRIIGLTFMNFTRFSDLRAVLGIASRTLIVRLKMLIRNGVIERIPGQSKRHEYVLTQKGRDLYPVVMAMVRWADTHVGEVNARKTAKTRRPTSKKPSPIGV
jgi:DNA-binding HxlR family transcriptional regulator